jgi:hypothetical protein
MVDSKRGKESKGIEATGGAEPARGVMRKMEMGMGWRWNRDGGRCRPRWGLNQAVCLAAFGGQWAAGSGLCCRLEAVCRLSVGCRLWILGSDCASNHMESRLVLPAGADDPKIQPTVFLSYPVLVDAHTAICLSSQRGV